MQQGSGIIGLGAKTPLANRPGVSQEFDPPHSVGNINRVGGPAQQILGTPSVESRWRALTPVYGTASPPRGLSGVIRKLAYRVPDYKPRRWMLLMLADRVDVIEHNVMPKVILVGVLALGVFGVRALVARRR